MSFRSASALRTSPRRARLLLIGGIVITVAAVSACAPNSVSTSPNVPSNATGDASLDRSIDRELNALERQFGAQLGVFAVDTGSGRTVQYGADERFAYTSTIKAIAAGIVLKSTDEAQLDSVVEYSRADIVEYSPITEPALQRQLTLREVADAAVRFSDNTAGNLLMRQLGGPMKLQAELRSLGDDTTLVNRLEPDLNGAVPGDDRDTTTPRALAQDLKALALGEVLDDSDRTELVEWLRGNTTGDTLIRAAVPQDWRVGDKSGAGSYGTRNDIAVIWPPHTHPMVLVVMSKQPDPEADYDDALIASAAKVSLAALRRKG